MGGARQVFDKMLLPWLALTNGQCADAIHSDPSFLVRRSFGSKDHLKEKDNLERKRKKIIKYDKWGHDLRVIMSIHLEQSIFF